MHTHTRTHKITYTCTHTHTLEYDRLQPSKGQDSVTATV